MTVQRMLFISSLVHFHITEDLWIVILLFCVTQHVQMEHTSCCLTLTPSHSKYNFRFSLAACVYSALICTIYGCWLYSVTLSLTLSSNAILLITVWHFFNRLLPSNNVRALKQMKPHLSLPASLCLRGHTLRRFGVFNTSLAVLFFYLFLLKSPLWWSFENWLIPNNTEIHHKQAGKRAALINMSSLCLLGFLLASSFFCCFIQHLVHRVQNVN